MEFSEALKALASKVQNQQDAIRTEEATKNAFIMPFISTVLGYDVFNPLEVIPEFTADVGIKKGEKIDYAIMHGGVVQILIECKKSSERDCCRFGSRQQCEDLGLRWKDVNHA